MKEIAVKLHPTTILFPESSFPLTSVHQMRASWNNGILPIHFHCIYGAHLKWLLPELLFLTTGQGERRVDGNKVVCSKYNQIYLKEHWAYSKTIRFCITMQY